MIKTLIAANRSEREAFRVPRSVQQSIPIHRIYKGGIWKVGNKYSKTWQITDINYAVASHEDQEKMFLAYAAVLNSLPTDATTKITINNRRMDMADFRRTVLLCERGDGLDEYRHEYTGYIVTADYSGGVVRTTMDDTVYTAIFSGTPIQTERNAFDWRYLLILPAGAGVAGLGVLGRNWLKKRKNEKKWEEYTE